MKTFIYLVVTTSFFLGIPLTPGWGKTNSLKGESNLKADQKRNNLRSDGNNLANFRIKGKSFQFAMGKGLPFGQKEYDLYQKIKKNSQLSQNFPVQWALRNLSTSQNIAHSLQAEMNFYGASVTKIFVAAALLHQQEGRLTTQQMQETLDLIVASDNKAWRSLQKQVGHGNHYRGQQEIWNFTKKIGLQSTIPFRGWHDSIHGNEVNALDLVYFLQATFDDTYPGADTMWTIMHGCRTGNSKANAYLPPDMMIGGKTGTYHGNTVHPVTKKPYRAKVHHHVITFSYQGETFALSVLSDRGSNQDVALMAGGLFREYIKEQIFLSDTRSNHRYDVSKNN